MLSNDSSFTFLINAQVCDNDEFIFSSNWRWFPTHAAAPSRGIHAGVITPLINVDISFAASACYPILRKVAKHLHAEYTLLIQHTDSFDYINACTCMCEMKYWILTYWEYHTSYSHHSSMILRSKIIGGIYVLYYIAGPSWYTCTCSTCYPMREYFRPCVFWAICLSNSGLV